MSVHLLTIPCLSLEVDRKGLAVEEAVASDNTCVDPLCQDIEQCSLAKYKRLGKVGQVPVHMHKLFLLQTRPSTLLVFRALHTPTRHLTNVVLLLKQ